ncbi:peptidase [Alcanivorax xiamenensis]|uniref:Peptidase n=1 Tax=Alcanivorax xiamenensis TaxID=1177156 RepID=A0ABQ6YAU2_9GAMM|nr:MULTISPECIES: PepSY domain-containing protein [Alcanivorax]KAF0807058.1 peptidase [Alcanivorax xiamenensis]
MQAKKAILTALFLGTATLTAGAHADDVGPDQAMKLVQEGKVKSFEELNKAAQAQHPNAKIEETELEKEFGGYVYKVELRDQDNVQWDVELNAANGEVIRNERDD